MVPSSELKSMLPATDPAHSRREHRRPSCATVSFLNLDVSLSPAAFAGFTYDAEHHEKTRLALRGLTADSRTGPRAVGRRRRAAEEHHDERADPAQDEGVGLR